MSQLSEFDRMCLTELDSDTQKRTQIIFMRGQTGHYSISRNQYYPDIDLINDSDLFKTKLRHEIQERAAVVKNPRYRYWKSNRGKMGVEKEIERFISDAHKTLLYMEKKQRILRIFKNIEGILKIEKGSNFETDWSRLSGLTQNMRYVNLFQLAIPIDVLKTLPDMHIALQRMSLLGKGKKQFELIIYNLDKESEAREIKDLLKELITFKKDGLNIRIHIVTKKGLSDFGGDIYSMSLTDKIKILNSFLDNPDNYPLGKDGYRLIITDEVVQEKVDLTLSEIQKGFEPKGNNTFVRILESRGIGRIFSLSNILINWLNSIEKTKDLTDRESILKLLVNIISPMQISPKELKEEIESQLTQAWELMTSA